MAEVYLNQIAHGRSGDKGDTSNVCVFARKPEYYEIIKREVTVEKVDYGFVAVRADAGDSEIVFHYRTPGLALGALLSLVGILLLLLYLFVMRRMKVKASYKFFREDYYESETVNEYLTKRELRRLERIDEPAPGTDGLPQTEDSPSADETGTDETPPTSDTSDAEKSAENDADQQE